MKQQFGQWVLAVSLALNIAIAFPALVLLLGSSGIQTVIYQQILAPRLGKPEIVFIGDSITQDGGLWGIRIGRYDFSTWNLAQAGLTTSQILQRQAVRIAASKPRYAFVMAGINDEDKTTNGAETSFRNYREILDTLKHAGTEPIIQLTLYRENEPAPEFIERLNDKLKVHAKQNDLSVIDLNLTLSRDRSLLPEYSRDGLHLTENAYDVWATEVRQLLAQKRSTRR